MKTKYLYIMGSASGVGKSTVCLGILAKLLDEGYTPELLAYFKPVTQCTDKQAVIQFCQANQIPHQEISEIIFAKGFTKAFVDDLTNNSETSLGKVLATIKHLGKGKALVIIDGIGNPATGSVVGIANADIALALNATVIFVGIPGIGAAIDDTVLCRAYLQSKGINSMGLIYNKIAPINLAEITHYVGKRVRELVPSATLLGFLPENATLQQRSIADENNEAIVSWFNTAIDSKVFRHFVIEN